MKEENPFKKAEEAHLRYLEEFDKFSKNYHKLFEYIKPFIGQNDKYMEICKNIQLSLVSLPISHMIINTVHMAQIKMLRDMTKSTMPPLKIDCPDCKKTIWDVTELRKVLDPEGRIWGKDSPHVSDE